MLKVKDRTRHCTVPVSEPGCAVFPLCHQLTLSKIPALYPIDGLSIFVTFATINILQLNAQVICFKNVLKRN